MKLFFFTFFLLLINMCTYCQPGSIDQSFGDKGFVITDVNKTDFFSYGQASALQRDGKIVAGGKSLITGILRLIRYSSGGIIDSSFGNNGIADIKANPIFSGNISAITIQADKKIIVAGDKWGQPHTEGVFAARFMPDGTLDNTFGNGGITKLDFGDYAGVSSIVLQHDGKILMAGGAGTDIQAVQYEYSTVTRLNEDGTIDKSFAEDGRIENNAANENNVINVRQDSKIITAGYQYLGSDNFPDYVVSCYNIDGTLDKSFGNNGNVMTDGFGFDDNAESIIVQPDGNIIVAGYSGALPYGYVMTALRYTTKGLLDNSFGVEGKARVFFEDKKARAYKALLQPDNKIILAGDVYSNNPTYSADFALCRLNKDGSVDSSFALDGRQITVVESSNASAQSALLQPDGKTVLVGESEGLQGDNPQVLLIRYNGDKEQKSLIARIKQFLHNHGISWQGLDNKNINYYSIQYSPTGKGFAEKGKLSGAGSSTLQQYNFPVAEAGFYRIVAVDRKGYKTFSNRVMVSAGDLASTASVYPNPVKDYVTVQGLSTNETANISIVNGIGILLAKGVSNGSAQYRASTANLQPGTYYLHITTGSTTETLKFVKE